MSELSLEDVKKHNQDNDCWIIIDGNVYDVSKFMNEHPGGKKVLLKVGGLDASKQFHGLHSPDTLAKHGPKLLIGRISARLTQTTPISSPEKPISTGFGDMVPYGDPFWYQDWHSPYYNDSHRRVRAAMRAFVEKEIKPFVQEWDIAMKIPRELFQKCAQAGWLAGVVGPPWPSKFTEGKIIGDIKPEEFDSFHELIIIDEVARAGSGGVVWGLFAGLQIGLPPLLHFASEKLRDKVAYDCLQGKKTICLAITEPYAGSDVAGLQASAVKSPDGKHYIVNGEKKWITNGIFADFFTTAVRTGGSGMGGVSLLLIEKSMPGVSTRQMNCQGVKCSGTTYVTFEDVKVPVENLIGEENKGFKYAMDNFVHERFGVIVQAARLARVCYEQAFVYAHKRKTFGQRLVDHPVIRYKLAHMIRQIEATQAWIENVTYQMTRMSHKEIQKLGGTMALLKAQTTTTFEYCAREASQIFGGLAYTAEGQGATIERLYREVRAYAIPAGSEEIMLDSGVRQAVKQYAKH